MGFMAIEIVFLQMARESKKGGEPSLWEAKIEHLGAYIEKTKTWPYQGLQARPCTRDPQSIVPLQVSPGHFPGTSTAIERLALARRPLKHRSGCGLR